MKLDTENLASEIRAIRYAFRKASAGLYSRQHLEPEHWDMTQEERNLVAAANVKLDEICLLLKENNIGNETPEWLSAIVAVSK